LFLAAGFVARGLQDERELGTLSRLRALPISAGTVVAAKGFTMLVVGIVEIAVAFTAMRILLGTDWGDTLAVAAVTLAIGLAVAALAMFLAALARSAQSAHFYELFCAMGLAALGGNIVALQNLPAPLQSIAAFTPNGIAIRTYRDIAANGSTISDVAGPVSIILGFALVLGLLGYVGSRRVVEG
jgi:ABC-2 type transport system permease protein